MSNDPGSQSHWELPEPSSWVGQPARLVVDGCSVTMSFGLTSGDSCQLRFEGVRAMRHRVDQLADPSIVRDYYDRLAIVPDSVWLGELQVLSAERGGWHRPVVHFALFLDGGGSYEFVAEGWSRIS